MKILVTGGLGFIGSHLVKRFINEGHSVVVIDEDVCSTNYLEELSLLNHNRLKIIEANIAHIDLGKLRGIDMIYHMARPASPEYWMHNQLYTFNTSVYGTHNVLRYAHSKKLRVLVASSSEVYGLAELEKQTEAYTGNLNTFSQRASYGEGARAAETLCSLYSNLGCAVRVARIFTTYGPGMSRVDGRFIPTFMVNALRNKPLEIYGKGDQKHALCYIDDTVELLVRLMESDLSIPVNIGNEGEIYTIREIAEKIIALTGSDSKIETKAPPYMISGSKCPDMQMAAMMLGYEATVGIDRGFIQTMEWFKSINLG